MQKHTEKSNRSKWGQEVYSSGPRPSITYQLSHLKQKPLRYFSNVGNVHKGERSRSVSLVKEVCGFKWANGIEHVTYYDGGRYKFPLHCQWLGPRGCEVTVFTIDGLKVIFSRIISVSRHQRIPKADLKDLGLVLKLWSDAISKAVRDLQV